MNEKTTEDSFSYHQEESQPNSSKQFLILQLEYQKIKKKYQKLKLKYKEHSDNEETEPNATKTFQTLSISSEKNPIKAQSGPQQQFDARNEKLIQSDLSDKFSWHQSQKSVPIHDTRLKNSKTSMEPLKNAQSIIDTSRTSENFNMEQPRIHSENKEQTNHSSTQKSYSDNKIEQNQSLLSSQSENSDNLSFSGSLNLNSLNSNQQKHNPSKPFSKNHSISQSNQSDNFTYQSVKNQDYNQIQNPNQSSNLNQSQNLSQNFTYRSAVQQKPQNFIPELNLSQNFSYESSGPSKQQGSNKFTFPIEKYRNLNGEVNPNQIQTLKKPQIDSGSINSFSDSKMGNNQNFKYEIKDFSFRLPEQINEPIEIDPSRVKPQYLEPIPKRKQESLPKYLNLSQNLNNFEGNFAEYPSDDEETQFYRKLVSKINLNKKVQISLLKKMSAAMQKLSQKYNFLQEIFQTGTYELDLTQIHDIKAQFFQELRASSKNLITQITMSNQDPYEQADSFFKQFQFPSLKSVTFRLQDQINTTQGRIEKNPNKAYDINFLRYFGVCKKLKSLTLKGQTMTETIATSIVDLDFPSLKTLYIGFQAPLTNQVADILLCNQLKNLPKCKIYIANWEGIVDDRFKAFYDKIDFQSLETDSQDM